MLFRRAATPRGVLDELEVVFDAVQTIPMLSMRTVLRLAPRKLLRTVRQA